MQVVRGHVCRLGFVFTVESIGSPSGLGYRCGYCGWSVDSLEQCAKYSDRGIPLSWLKRLPPPEELGIAAEREEIAV